MRDIERQFGLGNDSQAHAGNALVSKDGKVADPFVNLLRQVFKLFDDGKLVDCTGIERVGLFLKMFDEGGLIVDKLASKDDQILFKSIFEVRVGNGCQIHGVDVWCVYSFGLNLFFKDFFDIKYYMRWL